MPNTKYSPENDLMLAHDGLLFWDYENKARMLHVKRDDDPDDPRRDQDNISVMACFHPRHALGDKLDARTPGEFWDSLVRENFKGPALLAKLREGASKYFMQYMEDEGIEWDDPEEVLDTFHSAIEDGEVRFAMDLLKDLYAWLPLYLYDHSGITMSCGEREYPYNDVWDSSEVGWIVMPKANALAELGAKENDWRAKAVAHMKAEVRTYDGYLTGDVWTFALYDSRYPVRAMYEAETGEDDWSDTADMCSGFIGGYMFASGMAEAVGHGLPEALASGNYWTGTARPRKITVYSYARDKMEGEDA